MDMIRPFFLLIQRLKENFEECDKVSEKENFDLTMQILQINLEDMNLSKIEDKEKIELQTCALDVWNKTLNERVNATVNKLQLNEIMCYFTKLLFILNDPFHEIPKIEEFLKMCLKTVKKSLAEEMLEHSEEGLILYQKTLEQFNVSIRSSTCINVRNDNSLKLHSILLRVLALELNLLKDKETQNYEELVDVYSQLEKFKDFHILNVRNESSRWANDAVSMLEIENIEESIAKVSHKAIMKCVAVESFENAIKWANVCLKIFEKSKNASFQASMLRLLTRLHYEWSLELKRSDEVKAAECLVQAGNLIEKANMTFKCSLGSYWRLLIHVASDACSNVTICKDFVQLLVQPISIKTVVSAVAHLHQRSLGHVVSEVIQNFLTGESFCSLNTESQACMTWLCLSTACQNGSLCSLKKLTLHIEQYPGDILATIPPYVFTSTCRFLQERSLRHFEAEKFIEAYEVCDIIGRVVSMCGSTQTEINDITTIKRLSVLNIDDTAYLLDKAWHGLVGNLMAFKKALLNNEPSLEWTQKVISEMERDENSSFILKVMADLAIKYESKESLLMILQALERLLTGPHDRVPCLINIIFLSSAAASIDETTLKRYMCEAVALLNLIPPADVSLVDRLMKHIWNTALSVSPLNCIELYEACDQLLKQLQDSTEHEGHKFEWHMRRATCQLMLASASLCVASNDSQSQYYNKAKDSVKRCEALFEEAGVRNIMPYAILLSYKFDIILNDSSVHNKEREVLLLEIVDNAISLSCVSIDFHLAFVARLFKGNTNYHRIVASKALQKMLFKISESPKTDLIGLEKTYKLSIMTLLELKEFHQALQLIQQFFKESNQKKELEKIVTEWLLPVTWNCCLLLYSEWKSIADTDFKKEAVHYMQTASHFLLSIPFRKQLDFKEEIEETFLKIAAELDNNDLVPV